MDVGLNVIDEDCLTVTSLSLSSAFVNESELAVFFGVDDSYLVAEDVACDIDLLPISELNFLSDFLYCLDLFLV